MRLGIFDPAEVQPYKSIPLSVVNSADHRALALEVCARVRLCSCACACAPVRVCVCVCVCVLLLLQHEHLSRARAAGCAPGNGAPAEQRRAAVLYVVDQDDCPCGSQCERHENDAGMAAQAVRHRLFVLLIPIVLCFLILMRRWFYRCQK